MKKLILLTVVLAMLLSFTACGCAHQWEEATCQTPRTCSLCGKTEGTPADHTAGSLTVAAVDTEALTITHDLLCAVCGQVMETKQSATGIAPVDGRIHVSGEEWFTCLSTNIQQLGAGQTLYPYPVQSEDNVLLYSVVSTYGMLTVFSFQDSDGNTLTAENKSDRNLIHNIRIDGQFTNDTAKEFFMLLMVTLVSNNSALELEEANTLTSQIMSGNPVSDNGYTYAMEIISVEDHTVCVSINAE